MSEDDAPIRTLEERLVFENDYVRVFDDRVAFPDGHEGSYYYSRWKAPYGVGIVAVSGRRALLVRSYRYGERAFSLEIPMGFGIAGRSPVEQAAVELREETGLEAVGLEPLLRLGGAYTTHVYLAPLGAAALPSRAHQETTESIVGFEWLDLDGLRVAILEERGIADPITVASLLAAADRL